MLQKRENNFDLLRLLLAVLVLRCHAGLVGFQQKWTDDQYFLGGLWAVQCFFVISGYLIFRSWESKPILRVFAEKRARRILPAYVMVVVVTTLAFAGLSSLGVAEYFRNTATYKYMLANLSFLGFLQNSLPGVFENNAQSYVNGPLWTIKIEVMFYISVPIIAYMATKIPRRILFTALYLGGVIWNIGFEYLAEYTQRSSLERVAEQLPGQMAFFVSGGAIHYARSFVEKRLRWLTVGSIAVVAGYFAVSPLWFALAYPFALAVLVIGFANYFPYLGNFGRFGDFSYGIYIFHYPILQTLATFELPYSPGTVFAIGCTLTVIAAVASWHLLESKWLLKSSHYVQAMKRAESSSAEAPEPTETRD